MGAELTNIHARAGDGTAIATALAAQRRHWLAQDAETLAVSVQGDFATWQQAAA